MGKSNQIPIWFFIGALITTYGLIILGTGVLRWISPPAVPMVLDNLHADIGWGFLLLVIGTIYVIKYWPRKQRRNL